MADFDLSLAITTEGGDESAAEVNKVTKAQDDLALSIKRTDDNTKKAGPTAAENRARLQAQAKAINEVVRATNPAVSSQQMLDAAVRRAGSAYMAGKISAEAYARAQEIASRATFKAVNSVKQARMGTAQLGMQINDLATQISMGTSPMRAFSMQAGQIGWAMAQGQGKAAAFGRFLQGPWGAALLIGTMLLGTLIEKLTGAKDKTEDLTRAMELHKMSTEELSAAIKEEGEALDKNIRTAEEAEVQALRNAAATRQEVIDRRQHIVALIEEQRELLRLQQIQQQAPGQRGELATLGADVTSNRLGGLENELARANRQLADAQRNVTLARIPLLDRQSKSRTDPAAKIEADFQTGLAALHTQLKRRTISETEYNKRLDALNIETEALRKALAESKKKHRAPHEDPLGEQLSKEFGESILAAARSKEGLSETRDKGTLEAFFKDATGQQIDPEITAWCAAFVNAVLATKGAKGTGALNARSFLNWGTGTNDPQKGDVVVLRRGQDGAQGHVGFFAGTDAKGNVQVTGGNQGNRVSTQSFARSDVLGFRRAPSAAQQFDLDAKLQADEQKLTDWAEGVQLRISGIGSRFEDAPSGVKSARDAVAEIDKLMGDIAQKKPPNMDALLAQAKEAKAVIQDGISRPFEKFMEDQVQGLEIQRLVASGREDEAEAMETIFGLQKSMGELLPEEEAAVRAVLTLRRAEAREAEKARKSQEKYIQFVDSVRDSFRDIFDGTGEGLRNLPKKLGDSLMKLGGDIAFQSIFGDLFDDLKDDITGVKDLGDASQDTAKAAEAVTEAFAKLGKSADELAGKISGEPAPGEETPADKEKKAGVKSPAAAIKDALKKLGEAVFGKELAAKIGGFIQQALQGAAIGQTAANALLGPRSKTGNAAAAIGGAVGSVAGKVIGNMILPGIGGEIGSVLGSIGGGLLGGLLGGKKKLPGGGATITGVNGDAKFTGSSAIRNDVNALARSVQGGLREVADALGAGTGAFKVTVGKWDGDWRVNTSGGSLLKAGNPGVFDFNDDEQAALQFAIADAIKDGAILGLSAAVEKALKSSEDLNQALREALKVQEVEILLGGVGAKMELEFRQFEKLAKDRVRIAQEYGFDLVKVEELNAQERQKVLEDVLKERTGALQDILDDMLFGDLFEGTPADQRAALLQQIGQERTRAEAGVEGSAGRLADLERQLLEMSRDLFGTAGTEYASDRETVRLDAERIIALETQRALEAQQRAIESLAAAQQQNQLTNETNNILTTGNGLLDQILAAVRANGTTSGTAAGGGGGADSTFRFTPLTTNPT